MKLHLTILFILFNIFSSFAQTIFQNTYSNFYRSEAIEILEIPNGELMAVGNIYDSISQKSDILLLNLNIDGTIRQEKHYSTNEYDFVRDIALTADNHLLILGETLGLGNNSRDILLIKTDLNGDTTWVKHIDLNGKEIASHIFEDSNGDYLIAAQTDSYSTGEYDMLVIKMNSQGTVLWSTTYGNASEELLHHISEQPNGGYLLTGITNDGQTSKYGSILSISVNGNINWQKKIGGLQDDYLFWGEMRADSSIYIGGYTTSYGFGALDAHLSKLDFNGNLLWSKVYGTDHIDFATTYTSTPDGGVLFAGGEDFFTFKTNSDGDLLWNNQYKIRVDASPYRDLPEDVLVTSDGNYIIFGKNREFVLNHTDLYITKVTSTGTSLCKENDGRANEMTISPTIANTTLAENSQTITALSVSIDVFSKSDLLMKEVCSVSANKINIEEKILNIIPNPAKHSIQIKLPVKFDTKKLNISFWNTQGQLIKQLNTDDFSTISIQELPAGVYFVKVQNSQKSYVGKLLIE